MTCQLFVRNREPNDGVLQVAHYLDVAPQLETLHLNVSAIFLQFFEACMLVFVVLQERPVLGIL
jgi:hypothetical protein